MKFESMLPYPGDTTDIISALYPIPARLKSKIKPEKSIDPEVLFSCWYPANQIEVFSGLKDTGSFRIHCVCAPNIDALGYCYMEDDSEIMNDHGIDAVIALNPACIDAGLSLVDLYLHELAHLYCNNEDHDWKFATILNALRISNGLGPTVDEYDCRDSLATLSSDDHVRTAENLKIANELAEFLGARLAREPDDLRHYHGILQNVEFSLEDVFSEDPIDLAKIKAECLKALGL